MQIIIITAADANYFELVRGTILSVREKPEGANIAIGFFDLGCTPEQYKDAPHWELWAEYLEEGLQRHVSLMTDQIALNRLVYGTELFEKTEMLPALCNWSCNFGLPVWDKDRACFVEPYLPHGAIGILHMTGHKHDLVKLATTDGDTIEISLRYQPIQRPVSPQLKSDLPK